MTPEDAVAAARAAAAARVAAGGYREAVDGLDVAPTERVTRDRLLRFAVIEPDLSGVRSTRRGIAGRVMTAFKQGQLRVLRQYHGQLIAQQTRFNIHAVAYVTALEERVAALEAENERLRSS